MTPRSDPFHFIRARSVGAVVGLCILALVAPYRAAESWLGETLTPTLVELGVYALAGGVLAFLCRRSGLDLSRLFGPVPGAREALRTAALAVPMLALSVAGFWLLYWPLSFLAPGFVSAWALAPVPLLVEVGGRHPLLPNVLVFGVTCLAVPLFEEFVFRGLLLHRWAVRWNVRRSVVLTSLLFGLGHVDLIGGAAFGLVAAVLYIETRSLYHPLLLHAANNVLAFAATVAETSVLGTEPRMDVATLRELWWVGALGLAIGGPWTVRFLRAHWRPEAWTLPHAAGTLAPAKPLGHAPGP
ncbi:MAG: CPBP family intramembrane glutamic endopeptidase [Myxococcota bacterium]